MLAKKYVQTEYNTTNLAKALPEHSNKGDFLVKDQLQRKQKQEATLLAKRIFLVAITFAVFAFTMVARSGNLAMLGIELVNLRQQESDLIARNDLLKLEVSKLNSPERINKIAINSLGMTIAKHNLYITKENNKN